MCIDNGQITPGQADFRVNTYCKRQMIREQYKGKINELVFNFDLSIGMGLENSLKDAMAAMSGGAAADRERYRRSWSPTGCSDRQDRARTQRRPETEGPQDDWWTGLAGAAGGFGSLWRAVRLRSIVCACRMETVQCPWRRDRSRCDGRS